VSVIILFFTVVLISIKFGITLEDLHVVVFENAWAESKPFYFSITSSLRNAVLLSEQWDRVNNWIIARILENNSKYLLLLEYGEKVNVKGKLTPTLI
jgi:hypothetical protein